MSRLTLSFPTFLAVSVACVFSAGAQAHAPAAAKTLTIDESLEMQSVSNPRISPDGRRVIYSETRTNWETNAFDNDLWLADIASGERHLLTVQAGSNRGADWSPDGRWIAFLSDRPGVIKDSPAGKTRPLRHAL